MCQGVSIGGRRIEREANREGYLRKSWQGPTLPRLKPKYHWRDLVSRPSSGWDRVVPRCNNHQLILKYPSVTSSIKSHIHDKITDTHSVK